MAQIRLRDLMDKRIDEMRDRMIDRLLHSPCLHLYDKATGKCVWCGYEPAPGEFAPMINIEREGS